MRHDLRILLTLALTQIIGWGAVGVLPVIATPVAGEFGASLSSVFIGTSVMFFAMGIAAPWAGCGFRRFGTGRVMAVGAGLIGVGLWLLAGSPNLSVFWASWALIGLAGAMFLTTSAYVYLAEHAGEQARSLIATLMLVTGLATSVFWPLTASLDHLAGWRATVSVYAALMLLVVCPWIWFGLAPSSPATDLAPIRPGGRQGGIFPLLVAAIALNSFVTFGIEAVGIEILKTLGMDLARAVTVASLVGVFKVGGRVIDLLAGRRWDGLSTGIVASAMIPLGLAVVWIGGAGLASVTGYLLLFGTGSGAFAVARATMPLVFFEASEYAAAMAKIALPMNLINALAPPLIASMMTGIGAQATLAGLGGLSLVAFAILLILDSMRARPALAER